MSSTGIRIETIKEINDKGEEGYRITKIQALANKDLPKLYMDNGLVAILGTGWLNPENRLYLKNDGENLCFNGYTYIWPTFYTSKKMEEINAHIAAAGQHLADVNAHLKKERAAWNGKITFVDGQVESTETVLSEKLESESMLDRIPRLWIEGKLYYRDDKGKFRKI